MTDITKLELRIAQLEEQLHGDMDIIMRSDIEARIAEMKEIVRLYNEDLAQQQNAGQPVLDAASNEEEFKEYVENMQLEEPEEIAFAGEDTEEPDVPEEFLNGAYNAIGTDGDCWIKVDGKYTDLP